MKSTYVFFVGLIAAIALTFTGIWQLAIIASTLCGLLIESKKSGESLLVGMSSVLIAWIFFIIYAIITQPALDLMNMVFVLILGLDGYGFFGIILTLIIAALIGLIGGYLGFSIKMIIMKTENKAHSLPIE